MSVSEHDLQRMRRACALARKGHFQVEPNPPVGCVVERGEEGIVGEGWHKAYGGPHAEVEALRLAGDRARGATVYVTLAPCSHTGKTPPCADALIEAGVARVFFGAADPNPEVGEVGLERLRAAGVEVVGPVLEDEARSLLARFTRHLERRRPWVLAKWAMSLDGSISPRIGSGGAITGVRARRYTHELRGRVEAVLVGVRTVQADDPLLDCRLESGPPEGRSQPLRVILDLDGTTPPTLRMLGPPGGAPVLVYCSTAVPAERVAALAEAGAEVVAVAEESGGLALGHVLDDLHRRGVRRVLVEGGAQVHGSFFREGLVDQVSAFVAPRILGGHEAVPAVRGTGIASADAACVLEEVRWRKVGDDLLMEGYVPSVEPA